MERLDKVISSQCDKSRKEIHKLIWTGHVAVNGKTETKIDRKIDAKKDIIALDGSEVVYKEHIYLMLNKPEGCVSASTDAKAQTVIDLIPVPLKRKNLSPVGRLDKDTTGLLIITDDGDFSHKVTSPNKKVYKVYHALLDEALNENDVKKLEEGIEIDGGEVCKSAFAKMIDMDAKIAEIEICEGKYHQVKRMMQAVGKHVLKLERVSIGSLFLDEGLAQGECRELTDAEKELIFVSKREN